MSSRALENGSEAPQAFASARKVKALGAPYGKRRAGEKAVGNAFGPADRDRVATDGDVVEVVAGGLLQLRFKVVFGLFRMRGKPVRERRIQRRRLLVAPAVDELPAEIIMALADSPAAGELLERALRCRPRPR